MEGDLGRPGDGSLRDAGLREDLEGAAAELVLEDASEFEDDEEGADEFGGNLVAAGNESGSDSDSDSESEDPGAGGGAPVSPSLIPTIGVSDTITPLASTGGQPSLSPSRPIPYVVDAGHLLITDPNALAANTSEAMPRLSESVLASTARDAAQSLINALLTTCTITSAKNATSGSGLVMNLPAPSLSLPREKAVPTPKPPTKWELFAAKKGIGKNKRKGQEGNNRAGKMEYNESRDEWVPRYGYKGKNRAGEKEAIVEVDMKEERKQAQEAKAGRDPRTTSRAERLERIKRNERKMRANERKASKKGS